MQADTAFFAVVGVDPQSTVPWKGTRVTPSDDCHVIPFRHLSSSFSSLRLHVNGFVLHVGHLFLRKERLGGGYSGHCVCVGVFVWEEVKSRGVKCLLAAWRCGEALRGLFGNRDQKKITKEEDALKTVNK